MPTTRDITPDVVDDEPAALVVSHEIRQGSEARYEAWLKTVRVQVAAYSGHLGAEIVRPVAGSRVYTIMIRFDSVEHLNVWLNSQDRKTAIAQIAADLERADAPAVRPGMDIWFTPPGLRPPRKVKQFALTASLIFPSTLTVRWVLDASTSALGLSVPHVALHLATVLVVVALMVWVMFPKLTPRLSNWLAR